MEARKSDYDILIVGAGIAGSALAHALSDSSPLQPKRSLRIALLERSLAEPDRIVGELLQPGGVSALSTLGLRSCLDGIGAIPVHGYCVTYGGNNVHIPYPKGHEGRSFHHGRFIQKLRKNAKAAKGVDVVEATVKGLVQCSLTNRVLGVRAKKAGSSSLETIFANLIVIADGCFSNFRNQVLGQRVVSKRMRTKSNFVGVVLKNAKLPIDEHGTVALIPGHGPVLLYQIEEGDTRILIDVKSPLPPDLSSHIREKILPFLPSTIHIPLENALEKDRLRSMPNTFLPAILQSGHHCKDGVILLGDSWNMRHPLTGGGMTVALNDVALLSRLLLSCDDFTDQKQLSAVLERWHWSRKPLSSTINILSVALYDLFGADDENLAVLREGCFKYFQLGGECINGPVSLLAGIVASPTLLARHFFAVALYAIWVRFTHPRSYPSTSPGKVIMRRPMIQEYLFLFIQNLRVFWTACVVFGPLVWSECRWW